MSDKYGSYYNNGSYNVYRAAIRYETTDSTTSVTVRCRVWCQMGEGHDSSSNIQGQAYITDSYSAWVAGDGTYLNAGDESGFLGDITKVIQKGETAQTITCSGRVWGSTWNANSPWVNANVPIPALQSWDVTYNANSGSGAPASQKKFYGKSLTLSSTKPTRSGYTFQGWATSQANANAGTVAYKAGDSYTGNVGLGLYAVWKANATAPTITSFAAYRSTGGVRDDASTAQVTFALSWTMDSGASNRSVSFKYKIGSGSETTVSVSSPAVSGSTSMPVTVTFDGTSKMTVTATVTDSTHSLTATRTVTIGPVFKPFHMANGGLAAAFFGMAGAAWDRVLKVFGKLDIEGRTVSYVNGAKGDAGIRFYKSSTSEAQWNPCLLIQTKGGGNWTVGNYNGEEIRFVYTSKSKIDSSDNNPELNMSLGTTAKSWHKAISGWTSIATTTGTTAKSFADVQAAGYTEVLVVGTYTTSASYGGSVLIPVAQLSSTSRDWYLGGGYWSSGWGACCAMTLTSITPYKIRYNGNDGNGTWTVYAR